MRVAAPCVALLVFAVAGCGESRLAGSLLYMTPYKLEEFDCVELNKRIAGAAARVKDSEQLRDLAGASAAGPVINAVVYGPEYGKAVWELRLYQEQAARRGCDAPPTESEPAN